MRATERSAARLQRGQGPVEPLEIDTRKTAMSLQWGNACGRD
jgi:hypothetical protein